MVKVAKEVNLAKVVKALREVKVVKVVKVDNRAVKEASNNNYLI